jgi:hypothetical protein
MMMVDIVHDLIRVPQDAIAVEISTGVEPQVDPLLPASKATGEHIGLQDVGLAGCVAEELEVKLVVGGLGR